MTIITNLEIILADSYALYLKTQNYHWNVTGQEFKSLHLLFEEQYKDLINAIDEIAERIRALDAKVTKISKFIKLATVTEADSNLRAMAMVQDLAKDQDIIVTTLTNGLKIAQKFGDEASADIIIQRIKIHQKNRWMLVSSLNN
jgi:starvation-inducible DNA-binding protein